MAIVKFPVAASSLLLLLCGTFTYAAPDCEFGAASDTDSDGWGWENNESCRVVPVSATCIDSDGDGWGWNGQASCRVVPIDDGAGSVDGESGNLVCIDSDGDGWGWDGTKSCLIDTVSVLPEPEMPEVVTPAPAEPMDVQIDPNDPLFLEWASTGVYSSSSKDAHFNRCGESLTGDDALGPWSSTKEGCVCYVPLANRDNYVINERLPGYGTHVATGQVCLLTHSTYGSVAVPIYAVDENNYLKRQVFDRLHLRDLYFNGHQWQCTEDTRDTLDGVFTSGPTGILTFGAGGDAASDFAGDTVSGSWRMLQHQYATDVTRITVVDEADDIKLAANAQLSGDQLTLYRSAYNRLSCNRIASDYPFDRFSIDSNTLRDMYDQHDTLPTLNGDQINGRTLQCAPLEAFFNANHSGPAITMSYASDEEIVVPITLAGFDAYRGVETYRFGDYFGSFNAYGSSGVNFNSGYDSLSVRQYSEDLSVIDYDCCYVHGGGASYKSLWACKDIGGPSVCADYDGDGFGWNGFGSCTP